MFSPLFIIYCKADKVAPLPVMTEEVLGAEGSPVCCISLRSMCFSQGLGECDISLQSRDL